MNLKSFVTFLFFLALPFVVLGQVDSVATDSLPLESVPETVVTTQPDTLQSDSVTVLFKVRPWEYHAPIGAETAATDSTLRWQIWPSWSYKKNRDPGVISYRLGSIGRTNTQQIYAHAPEDQQLYWEDIRMNDPVSGMVNWNYIPHHKIGTLYENNLGTVHRTTFYLKEYYLNKALTQLNYTESSFNTRSLEFMASNNFSQRTNAEISYWDRRDGGEYNNSEITGRQIYARVTHQLDDRQALKFKFLNNNYNNELPFGYIIPNPGSFAFNPSETSAVESSGQGNRSSSIIGLNYYRRPADTTNTTSNMHAGIYMNNSKREVKFSADTTAYNVRALGGHIRQWQSRGPLELEAATSFDYFIQHGESISLASGNWVLWSGEVKAKVEPFHGLAISGMGSHRQRSDGYGDYRIGGELELAWPDLATLKAGYVKGARMPTRQQLYWRSRQFQGNPDLDREHVEELHAEVNFKFFPGLDIGSRGQLKQISDGIMMGADSSFTNVNDYESLAAAAYFNYESRLFEFSGSATYQQFGNFLKSKTAPLPLDETGRIWFKGSAYVKGYLFDRATYVKAGLSGMITPQSYFPAQYYPSLDYWQVSGNSVIPTFNRLDVDLSARVRTIMVVLRYENVLDDVVQQGYFETPGYPMTKGRFLFGIRVRFRN